MRRCGRRAARSSAASLPRRFHHGHVVAGDERRRVERFTHRPRERDRAVGVGRGHGLRGARLIRERRDERGARAAVPTHAVDIEVVVAHRRTHVQPDRLALVDRLPIEVTDDGHRGRRTVGRRCRRTTTVGLGPRRRVTRLFDHGVEIAVRIGRVGQQRVDVGGTPRGGAGLLVLECNRRLRPGRAVDGHYDQGTGDERRDDQDREQPRARHAPLSFAFHSSTPRGRIVDRPPPDVSRGHQNH